jgi:hypothetical protein
LLHHGILLLDGVALLDNGVLMDEWDEACYGIEIPVGPSDGEGQSKGRKMMYSL